MVVAKSSVLVYSLQYDGRIWDIIWNEVCEIYDKDEVRRPTRANSSKTRIIGELKAYVEEQSKFIGEFPKVLAYNISSTEKCPVYSPYRPVYTCMPYVDVNAIDVDEMNTLRDTYNTIIEDAYNISRVLAEELITFLLTDTDRQYNKNIPAHNPIAYGLKGKFLSTPQIRAMLEKVRDKCVDEEVKILCEVSDGQFRKAVCRSIDDKPLTWIQWQRDNWSKCHDRINKKDLMTKLGAIVAVSDDTLDTLADYDFTGDQVQFEDGNLKIDKFVESDPDGDKHVYYLGSCGGGLTTDGRSLSHLIHSTKKWTHKSYDPIWDYRQNMRQSQKLVEELQQSEVRDIIDIEINLAGDQQDGSAAEDDEDDIDPSQQQRQQSRRRRGRQARGTQSDADDLDSENDLVTGTPAGTDNETEDEAPTGSTAAGHPTSGDIDDDEDGTPPNSQQSTVPNSQAEPGGSGGATSGPPSPLTDRSNTLLERILIRLQSQPHKTGHDFWGETTVKDLVQMRMASAVSINENFYHYELDIVADEVANRFPKKQRLFKKSANKATKINIVSRYFGDSTLFSREINSHRTRMKSAPTLLKLAEKFMSRAMYQKAMLSASHARVQHHLHFEDWKLEQTMGLGVFIPQVDRFFEYTYYPEYSEKRDQIEPREYTFKLCRQSDQQQNDFSPFRSPMFHYYLSTCNLTSPL